MNQQVLVDTDIFIDFGRAFHWMKKYRSKYGVEINDMLIAGTANVNGSKLISKNQKHYKFIPDPDLLEYPLVGV